MYPPDASQLCLALKKEMRRNKKREDDRGKGINGENTVK